MSVSDLKVTPFLIPQLSQPVRSGCVAATWSRTGATIRSIRTRASTNGGPRAAPSALGSQRNFLRFLVRNASYHQIGKRLVLARSTQFGDMYAFQFTGDPLDAIPLPERFFGGGGTSHRGFPENQAGPRDPTTGFPLGGTALLFNQTELRFPLIGENIGGVLFHDMGNIYSSCRQDLVPGEAARTRRS